MCPGNHSWYVAHRRLADLFWNLHLILGVRLAFFKANWNDILFPEDQNTFDKIAFEILTKPDGLAPFPFAIDDKRTSIKKNLSTEMTTS